FCSSPIPSAPTTKYMTSHSSSRIAAPLYPFLGAMKKNTRSLSQGKFAATNASSKKTMMTEPCDIVLVLGASADSRCTKRDQLPRKEPKHQHRKSIGAQRQPYIGIHFNS